MKNIPLNEAQEILGLIKFGWVIHGFIDGFSRLVVAMQVSNNNRAITVGHLFVRATQLYGLPFRVRGDHGTENLVVAGIMERERGLGRGSYIWGP